MGVLMWTTWTAGTKSLSSKIVHASSPLTSSVARSSRKMARTAFNVIKYRQKNATTLHVRFARMYASHALASIARNLPMISRTQWEAELSQRAYEAVRVGEA